MSYTLMSKDSIQYLCGLIRNLANVSEGIDDLNLHSDSTFSSVKINTLLNTLKTDCNEYTDRLVANLSRLELKLVTDESDITDSNILYLYKLDGATSYNQYVVIDGTKVLLGTCDINMGDYYTISQSDNKFALKIDLDMLTTSFNNLVTTVDKKIDKDNIVTVLDNTVTDEQIVSAKAVYDKFTNTVADVSNKDITSSFNTQVANTSSIAYTVKNGICYVKITGLIPLVVCNKNIILPNGTLPKPYGGSYYASISTWDSTNTSTILLLVTPTGSLELWCNSNTLNKLHYGSFSYPVAE